MERRYLVAALAIIATFAVFSHGLRKLEHSSFGQHPDLTGKCPSSTSRFMGKLQAYLHPNFAKSAQILAEMGLPVALAQAKVAEDVARQNTAAAERASAMALRQAERARREAERAQREAARMRDRMARRNPSGLQPAWEANMAADIDRQVRASTAALAQRIAAQSVQMAAQQMPDISLQVSDSDAPIADSGEADQNSDSYSYSQSHSDDASSKAGCDVQSRAQQTASSIRTRTRAIVHQVQQSFTYR